MSYFYDIYLNFNDYPIQCYDWCDDDNIERILKVKMFRVLNIDDFIKYECDIDLNDGIYLLSDTINAIGIEVINKRIAYLSYLKYSDELNVCKAVCNLDLQKLDYKRKKKRVINHELREDKKIKNELLSLIKESNDNLLMYIYYDITNKYSNKINDIRSFLIEDILNNFNQKHINLYQNICK